jgi:uncharacterized membrane protein YfcA
VIELQRWSEEVRHRHELGDREISSFSEGVGIAIEQWRRDHDTYEGSAWRIPYCCLGVGMVMGAQLGANLSNRIKGSWIIRSLAIALVVVGVRMLFAAIH